MGFPDGKNGNLVQRLAEDAGNQTSKFSIKSDEKRADINTSLNTVQYLGIALDEPERLERCHKKGQVSPLEMIGWTEADAKKWCIDNDLLSPIYTDTCLRGGCWFCHNQSIQQLRELRHNYPDLWGHLMRLDLDSPVPFKADGHTVHDFDKRFECEDRGMWSKDDRHFRWSWIDNPPDHQIGIDDLLK